MTTRKSIPKGIDPAFPNRNFVRATYVNHDDLDGFYKYMSGVSSAEGTFPGKYAFIDQKKPSGYGHSIGQRAGKLRLSGKAGAHRIGKR